MGLAVGPRPARVAHRVLGDGRGAFGPAFEIHGGGLDLVFPHHENEVAQSRALGHPFASIWAHNGMLRFTGEKMSKSLGNVATIREALDEWGRETLLVFFLDGALAQADRLLRGDDGAGGGPRATRSGTRSRCRPPSTTEARWEPFAAALEDDFDTPAALAVLHDWAAGGQLELLARGLDVFGLGSLAERDEAPSEVAGARRARGPQARAARDFDAADRLRDELAAPRLGDARRAGRRALVRASVTPDLVYGRRAVREALRGPARGARALGDRARGRARSRGLRRRGRRS